MRYGGLVLALFAVGCDEGPNPIVPLAEFGPRFAAAQCARVFRCCSVAQVQALYGSSVTDESACVAQLTPVAQLAATQLQQEQTKGRVRYDGRGAASCFRNMGTAPCTAASNDTSGITGCDYYVVPLVATGGGCLGDSECMTHFCDRPLTPNTEGVCAVLPTKGMACTSRCAPGASCDVAGMCVDPKPDGSTCFVDEDCVSGNCDNPNLTGGTCAAAPGATCGPAA